MDKKQYNMSEKILVTRKNSIASRIRDTKKKLKDLEKYAKETDKLLTKKRAEIKAAKATKTTGKKTKRRTTAKVGPQGSFSV